MESVPSLGSPAECPRCGMVVLYPEWSENVGPQRVASIWHCQVCGSEFETTAQGAVKTHSNAELMRAYFSNLLVA